MIGRHDSERVHACLAAEPSLLSLSLLTSKTGRGEEEEKEEERVRCWGLFVPETGDFEHFSAAAAGQMGGD